MSDRILVRAPGKINVALAIGPRRSDGYHSLATAFLALDLAEDLEAGPAEQFALEYAPGPIDTRALDGGDGNLAVRAVRLLADFTGHEAGIRMRITKRVPIAGGMGGGSADAAAALVAADALWGTSVSNEDLLSLGAKLGSDVPFALLGGAAVGTGRGDELSPALVGGRFEWVLRFSDQGISTPAAYAALDEHRRRFAADLGPTAEPVLADGVLQALRSGDARALAEVLSNDLQAPALSGRPDLARALELGESSGALAGLVSGSGPTIAFLAEDADTAGELAAELAGAGERVVRASGPALGARVLTN